MHMRNIKLSVAELSVFELCALKQHIHSGHFVAKTTSTILQKRHRNLTHMTIVDCSLQEIFFISIFAFVGIPYQSQYMSVLQGSKPHCLDRRRQKYLFQARNQGYIEELQLPCKWQNCTKYFHWLEKLVNHNLVKTTRFMHFYFFKCFLSIIGRSLGIHVCICVSCITDIYLDVFRYSMPAWNICFLHRQFMLC